MLWRPRLGKMRRSGRGDGAPEGGLACGRGLAGVPRGCSTPLGPVRWWGGGFRGGAAPLGPCMFRSGDVVRDVATG